MSGSIHERAELKVLSLANDKHKFAIQVGYIHEDDEVQLALERGMDNDWFTLIDVAPVSVAPGRLMRVFKLTLEGRQHLHRLRLKGVDA